MRVIECLGLAKADYMDVDRLQRELHEQAIAGGGDAIVVSEMQPVWTAGRHTKPEHIPDTSIRVIHVDRAGSATWHGPGQLVCYPVVKLKEPVDLYAWIRAVEAGVIGTIREEWQLPVHRVEGRAGVWLTEEGRADRKICAIGLKVARGATLHGLALNVDIDPASAFSGIIPCGLSDADVTSLSWEGVHTDVRTAAQLLLPHLFAHIRPLLAKPDQELEDWIVR
ncbi:lipoyl(octanoyl) transferase LipB [Schaalia cardiffensis]|uniref:lipoyl(octanoyl) transferase LipB n=1 Tax=Schaalia cardiffensis TaxID=181487 RepID=UPI0039FD56B0